MHKPLMSEAESMAYTATSPRDVKPPPMAMVEPGRGLSQDPVFTGAAACPSRPSSWRTWRPSATFAQGLGPAPDNLQPPPPPPRGSGGSTGGDSSMPDEYGAWPPTASDAGLTALTPAPGQRQQQGEAGGGRHALSYVVAYWETPLATPRTPTVVEGEQLAPLATRQEASPVNNCDADSGEGGREAGRGGRRRRRSTRSEKRRVSGSIGGHGDDGPEGGIRGAQLGREAGAGGGHGGGSQGVEAEPPRGQGGQQAEQGQQGEPGERGEPVFEEVAAVPETARAERPQHQPAARHLPRSVALGLGWGV